MDHTDYPNNEDPRLNPESVDPPIWNLFQGGAPSGSDPASEEATGIPVVEEQDPFEFNFPDIPFLSAEEDLSEDPIIDFHFPGEPAVEVFAAQQEDPAPQEPEPQEPAPDAPSFSGMPPLTDLDSVPQADAAPSGASVPSEQEAESQSSFMSRIPDVDDQPEQNPGQDSDELYALLGDADLLTPSHAPEAEDDNDDQQYNDDGVNHTVESAPARRTGRQKKTVRKGRPKRKKGQGLFGIPQIISTAVWLVLIVVIGVTAGRMLWVCAADVLAFGREDKVVTITVYETDTMTQIIDKLYQGGLIRYKGLFTLYASISDAEEDIQPGIYDLNTRYDYHALVNMMSPRSSREVVQLTIPEGYSCRQIFALLEENRICTAVDIGSYAARGELDDYWFLEGVPRGDHYSLEGFLFPDTYQFYKNSTPKEALERMLDNYGVRFNEDMRSQINTLNATLGTNYTVREITIVASLIEKESANAEESPRIAGVIYNRLFRWNGTPAYLNIDASIIYALNGKTDLTQEDMRVDSPYNTYTHTGLPPTPISNPGLSSLKAALNPENHNYYYYVLNPTTGRHQFSTTYDEHLGYVNQFAGAQ